MQRSEFRCWVEVPVRWGDMDALGHVNNAAYFTFCESGRIRYFELIGLGRLEEAAEGPALANASLDFRRQVHYPALLDVGTRVSEVRNRSFRMDYGIFLGGTEVVVAEGTSVVVWADYEAGRSVPLPERLRAAIEAVEAGQTS